jgi:hypothetical protein
MKYDKQIVELIYDCAVKLVKNGKPTFARVDIINELRKKYTGINEWTIRPMIQGMTINLEGGAPGALDKNAFLSIDRGEFILLTKANFKKYIGNTISKVE